MHTQIVLLSLAARLATLNGAAASRCAHRPVSQAASLYSTTTTTTTGHLSSSTSSMISSYTDVHASQNPSQSTLDVTTSTTLSGSLTETGTAATEVTTTDYSTTEDPTSTPTNAPPAPTLPTNFNLVRLDANGQETDGFAEPFPHALGFVVSPTAWIPLHLDVASGRVMSGGRYLCAGYGTQSDLVGYTDLCDGNEDDKRPATCVATSSSSISCAVPKCARVYDPEAGDGEYVVTCDPNDAPLNTWYSYNGFGVSLLLGPAEYTGSLSADRLTKLVYTLKEISPNPSQAAQP